MYQVMAETHEGTTHVLRKRFATEDDALNHPVRLARWKRVWVSKSPPSKEPDNSLPLFPWTVEWVGGFAYVLDANGRRIATLLGTPICREHVAGVLYDLSDQERRKYLEVL